VTLLFTIEALNVLTITAQLHVDKSISQFEGLEKNESNWMSVNAKTDFLELTLTMNLVADVAPIYSAGIFLSLLILMVDQCLLVTCDAVVSLMPRETSI